MYTTAAALKSYNTARVNDTATPVELTIMLYDGAIDFLHKANSFIRQGKIGEKGRCLSRAIAIIDELLSTLNMEAGGEIASNLKDLYQHMMTEILAANLRNDPEKIEQVIGLIRKIREGFAEISEPSQGAAVSTTSALARTRPGIVMSV